jgi:hypothetical protein
MASKLTPVGWIAKFLLVPAACVALGYFVVGPRIGSAPRAKSATSETAAPADASQNDAPASAATPPAPEHKKTPPPPDVSVGVRPIDPDAPNLGGDADVQTTDDPSPGVDEPKPRQRRIKPDSHDYGVGSQG